MDTPQHGGWPGWTRRNLLPGRAPRNEAQCSDLTIRRSLTERKGPLHDFHRALDREGGKLLQSAGSWSGQTTRGLHEL